MLSRFYITYIFDTTDRLVVVYINKFVNHEHIVLTTLLWNQA